MSAPLVPLMLGATAFGFLVAALFFVRFFRDTRDGLFMYFAIAFVIEALNRCVLAFAPRPNEGDPSLYLLRAFAYSLILVGIYRKNR